MENKMKISSEELAEIAGKNGGEVEWAGRTIYVKQFLAFEDMMAFVDGVSSGCFAKSDGSYMPEARDFLFRCHIVDNYTNIELPDAIEEKNRLLYGTNIIEVIIRNIDRGQFQAIIDAIEKNVAYAVDMNVKQFNDNVEKIYGEITKLYEQLTSVFEGIDKDTMTAIAQAVAGTTFDEKKLVDAVIEARNADGHGGGKLEVVK